MQTSTAALIRGRTSAKFLALTSMMVYVSWQVHAEAMPNFGAIKVLARHSSAYRPAAAHAMMQTLPRYASPAHAAGMLEPSAQLQHLLAGIAQLLTPEQLVPELAQHEYHMMDKHRLWYAWLTAHTLLVRTHLHRARRLANQASRLSPRFQ